MKKIAVCNVHNQCTLKWAFMAKAETIIQSINHSEIVFQSQHTKKQ